VFYQEQLEHFPTKVVPGSAKKMRQKKELEPRSDSEGTVRALALDCAGGVKFGTTSIESFGESI